MYSFSCFFAGLCAFVPNKPLDAGATRMRVIIPEGEIGSKKLGLPKHFAVAIVPIRNLAPGTAQMPGVPDITFRVQGSHQLALYLLKGLDLSFDFGGDGLPDNLEIDLREPNQPDDPKSEEEEFFFWSVDLSKGVPAAKDIDPACLAAVPDEDRVASRVALTSGSVKTSTLARIGDEILVFDFDNPNGTYTQALAKEVVLSKTNLTSPIRLQGRVFGAEDKALDLSLLPGEGEDQVKIEIACLELQGIFRIHDREPQRGAAEDIKLIYRLTQGASAIDQLPVPVARGAVGRPVHCPNVTLFAHNDA
jgi:hypothetical protein